MQFGRYAAFSIYTPLSVYSLFIESRFIWFLWFSVQSAQSVFSIYWIWIHLINLIPQFNQHNPYSLLIESRFIWYLWFLSSISTIRILISKLMIIIEPFNLQFRCAKNEKCPYYRCSNSVKYARGFTGFQMQMFPQQYEQFMTTLIMHFGRNQYFARRRGEIILPPEEQQIIRTLLQQIGADPSMDFDNYEELICWDV